MSFSSEPAVHALSSIARAGETDALQAPRRSAAAPSGPQFSEAMRNVQATNVEQPLTLGGRFEAATLTNFLGALLPDDDSSVWGGASGKMWRGLFAEHLAEEVARSGGVGIAAMIDSAIAEKTQNGGAELDPSIDPTQRTGDHS